MLFAKPLMALREYETARILLAGLMKECSTNLIKWALTRALPPFLVTCSADL